MARPTSKATRSGSHEHTRPIPLLHTLLKSTAEHGLRINCDELANELADIWPQFEGVPITTERAADMITRFVPLAVSFAEHTPMQTIFEQARSMIRATAASNHTLEPTA